MTQLRVPGDGTLRYTEDGWTACDRARHPERPVEREEVIFRLGEDGEAREVDREPSGETQRCDELAACPFVYVRRGGEEVLAGEILRNQRGSGAYALQSLALPGPASRGLEIRLAEEKQEVTYLDELYVEVGSERVRPIACASGETPRYCEADRRFFRLRPGESLDVRFDVPAGRAPILHARGFYVPTPGAR